MTTSGYWSSKYGVAQIGHVSSFFSDFLFTRSRVSRNDGGNPRLAESLPWGNSLAGSVGRKFNRSERGTFGRASCDWVCGSLDTYEFGIQSGYTALENTIRETSVSEQLVTTKTLAPVEGPCSVLLYDHLHGY